MVVLAVLAGGVTWLVLALRKPPAPACGTPDYSLSPQQAQNAATIAGVGVRLGMPDHAVTVALATALQESKLRNLTGGDRDSAGLFQQRPSQGWGTYEQVTDPVHAANAFYQRLRAQPDWTQLTVTQAAQLVQRSGAPDAYAQWEPEARALAGALTGETAATFTCHDLALDTTGAAGLVTVANAELGTAVLTGPHDPARGWALATWLVANATRFGVDKVTFDGRTWTSAGGSWESTGPADGRLSLHQASPPG
ncbi:hypothetical protein LWP59_20215 [Amycolatopsis acidiphila]|uniref:hypothetical protein n=1 Tax=Amycolatopsis acidiphila TaxID=715473 RepID=UPI0019BEF911|nr:hypothetical protein [Amycolatopsis acidiphila]UIJ56519.1 hypothetical protein LWP59_20215 [Amycolatopsis acidiphila]GHG66845.1 hypothetical protein GCM10017788_25220 [Amycolatopsis acidiphila]